jgi:riboflavin kinase / FMN adenylyltransferase
MTRVSKCNIYHKVSTDSGFDEPCGLAIGSFDGVHRGHQAIVQNVVEQSHRLGIKARLLTFYPRPSEYFAADKILPSLMSWREKVGFLATLGLDDVICMPFNARLSRLSAEDFVQDILLDGLKAQYLSIGEDFHFGANRGGNAALLEDMSETVGFELAITDTQLDGDARISSTRIRQSLLEGDMDSAERMLGRPYQLAGRVIQGRQLGREIGVPTANLHLKRNRLCVNGVFAAKAWLGDRAYIAVANVGYRPAVNKLDKPLLEVHLLDYDGDLYGEWLEVDLLYKMREEQEFDSLQSLVQQIHIDIEKARDWHSGDALNISA